MFQGLRRGVGALTSKVCRQYLGESRAAARILESNGPMPMASRTFSSLGLSKTILPKKNLAPIQSLVRCAHDQRTKGDEELLGFLSEEIATEKKLQRSSTIPTSLGGFSVKLEKADVTLTKKDGNEEITISTNVNHSVDSDYPEDPAAAKQPKEGDEMRSRPNFDVEIRRGNQAINFTCSFIQNGPEGEGQEEFNDIFSIDEIRLFEGGECEENDYSVAGDILDGYLYDLFMNLLEERGVTNEFVDKFSELCTDYEHTLYVDLLGKLQKFLEK